MQINLNGEACTCTDGQTIQTLIEQENLADKRIAVEVNLEIVPRSQFASHVLNEGDRVEIVHAIGGG